MARSRGTGALLAVQAALAVVVLAGCVGAEPPQNGTPSGDPDAILVCQGVEVPALALQEPRPATELPDDVIAALEHDNSPVTGAFSEWLIAEETPEHVVIMRKLDPPDDLGAGDVRDYELVSISASPGAMPLTPPWGVDMSTSCTPRIDVDPLMEAGLALDPEAPPESSDERIALLVTEHACNGGHPATGRVELVDLIETTTTVELVIAVRPHDVDGAFTCPGNQPTPFTVDLEQPLGDRVIMDASVVPQREITVLEQR